jgi:hypothetical protein
MQNRDDSDLRYLPFYDLSAIWLKSQGGNVHGAEHLEGDQLFGSWIRSDTGLDKYSAQFDGSEPEGTRSLLVLSVVVCDVPAPLPFDWFDNVWCAIRYPSEGEVNTSDASGYRCYVMSIPLEPLSDRSAVDAAIENWCARAVPALDAVPFAQHR